MGIEQISLREENIMQLKRITILVVSGLMFLSIQCLAKSAEEGYQSFSVAFEQEGKAIKPNGHVINLQKREFAIVVNFARLYHNRGEAFRALW